MKRQTDWVWVRKEERKVQENGRMESFQSGILTASRQRAVGESSYEVL
jgi:hypothetical protein